MSFKRFGTVEKLTIEVKCEGCKLQCDVNKKKGCKRKEAAKENKQ